MKKRLFIVFILVFFPFYLVRAQVLFSEVMYDLKTGSDDGREWIEVYNSSENSVDLSQFKFFEGDTNHKLVFFSGKEKLEPKSYALIVENSQKFMTDHPNFVGNIFDSTFSLNNSGENLVLKNGEEVEDAFKYSGGMGASGDGNSLQKINGIWVSAPPTPGNENKIVVIPKAMQNSQTILPKIQKVENKIIVPIVDNLPANVSSANFIPENTKSKTNYLFQIIFSIFIVLSSFVVYFVRKQKILTLKEDDFEILDD